MKLLWLAWRNIRYYRDVSAAIVISIAIAVTLLFLGMVVNWGIDRGLQTCAQRFGADLLVIPEGVQSELESVFWLGQPAKHYFDGRVLDGLRSVKGVSKVSPQVYLESAAASCCTAGHVFLIGYDPRTDFTVLPWIGFRQESGYGEDDAVVGANIIQPVGLHLVFYNHRFKIAAQLDRTGLGVYDNAVYLPMETVYRMAEDSKTKSRTNKIELKEGSISAVLVRLEKGASPTKVSQEIERQNPGLQTVRMAGLAQAVKEKLPQLQQNFTFWLVAVWISTLFFIAIIFYLFNQTRRREHGLLRAMGGSKTDLIFLSLFEGGILTSLGGITGIALALILKSLFYNWLMLSLKMPLLYPAFTVQLLSAALLTFSVFVFGLAAIAYPAYAMASEEPYESIRYSG